MAQNKKKKFDKTGLIPLIVNCMIIVVLVIALAIGNAQALRFEALIDSVLAQPIVDREELSIATASGQKLAQRIVEEGTILLKNDNDVLPLDMEETAKVNVFGWHSIDWLYGTGGGGSSSGGVLPEDDDISKNVDLYKALNEYGIRYNEELYSMYHRYKRPYRIATGWQAGRTADAQYLVEPSISDKSYYSDSLLNNAKAFSDTAFVVISRLNGEGGLTYKYQPKEGPNGKTTDNDRHFLEISTEEEELLRYVGANFEKVIVLINSSNQFELGFLDTIEGLDACLYVGFTGTRAATALPRVIWGEVTPSGHTVDTFAYDMLENPSAIWVEHKYSNSSTTHLDKVAGIYVGYKWYETADAEGLWCAANGYPNGYRDVVQFPFGFGLSYTTFDWAVEDIKVDGVSVKEGAALSANSKVEFTVTVTNTGAVAGRDVVELFCTAPYTPGEIEKSFVNLVGYAKTNSIEPGGSETVTVAADMYDVASYDCYDLNNNGFKGYELDKGDYAFKLMTDSHTIKEVAYDGATRSGSFTLNIPETLQIPNDPTTGQPVKNLFTGEDAVDSVPIDGEEEGYESGIPWISRADMPTPAECRQQYDSFQHQKSPTLLNAPSLTTRWKEWDAQTGNDVFGNPIDTSPVTWGKGNSLKIAENGIITQLGEKLGADYDDPDWEALLDQITFDEAFGVISHYYGSAAINSVGKPKLTDLDGPTQIKGFNTAPRGTGYPSMVINGASWNPHLAYQFGQSYGDDMSALGISGVWGFACDLHLDPFFARNNESPSEDPFLAGTTIANAVRGLNTRGHYSFIKHFANFQTNLAQNTWMSEQAFRETSLKAFRKVYVDGGALGAMTSYQSVGGEGATRTEATITGVLRGEWCFRGAITTDASADGNLIEGLLRCGGNFGMNNDLGANGISYSASSTSNRLQHRMRDAVHQILYMWLHADYNARMYALNPDTGDSYTSSTTIDSWKWWKPLMYTIDATMACIFAFWLFTVVSGYAVGLRTRKQKAAAQSQETPEREGAPQNKGGRKQ